jgi:hypothetical protein
VTLWEVPATVRSLYPETKLEKELLVDTSRRYPVAPAVATQFAVNEDAVIDVAVEGVGATHSVNAVIVVEFALVPKGFTALTR